MTDDAYDSRYIPAEIKRLVLVEAGHCCALPTCQYPATQFAHIFPFAKVKEHKADNLIALCPNHHDLYDNKKQIDRKSMLLYKQKLQFLNKRYTKYELRILALLAEKPVVIAAGEIQMMGLLKDELIRNEKTFLRQNVTLSDADGRMAFEDSAVVSFAAVLTKKGTAFIENWKSKTEDFEVFL
jgi:hypothetical protein